MDKFIYYLFRIFVALFRFVPFWLLYIIADFIYLIVYKLVGYRKEVVNSNLKKAFPSKTAEEIKVIEKKFFKNLSMVMIESIKGFSVSDKEMKNRYKLINKEVADKYFNEGKDVIALAGHYANWEWASYAISTVEQQVITLYKTLSNKYIDKYLKSNRSEGGVEMISIDNTRSAFSKKENKPKMIVLVADQNPGNPRHAIWLNFLGIDTACIHGPEFFTRFYKMPVIFLDVQRVKKGYYTLEIIDLGEDLWQKPKEEITKIYMKTLENIILKKPEDWLWSHKRWKRTREVNN